MQLQVERYMKLYFFYIVQGKKMENRLLKKNIRIHILGQRVLKSEKDAS